MKSKANTIFITGGHFIQEKSMAFRQLESVGRCMQSFISAQIRGPRITELWVKVTFLLEQQINPGLIREPRP